MRTQHAVQFLFISAGVLLGCNPSPALTEKGTARGDVARATIGAAGGTLTSADGKAKLVVPAGALSADVELGLQETSSVALGGVGSGWRLTPDGQKFGAPATLFVAYTDADLAGVPSEALAFATQRPDGAWKLETVATLDAATMLASGPISHFSDWSLVYGVQMRPANGNVKVGKTQALSIAHCYAKQPDDDLTWLGYECDPGDDDLAPLLPLAKTLAWAVNGVEGGGGEFGSVSGSDNRGVFTAPAKRPSAPLVAVSAEVSLFTRGKTLVVSNLTITDDSASYTGSFNGSQTGDIAYTVSAASMLLQSASATRFKGTGTAQVSYSIKCGMTTGTFSGAVPFDAELTLESPSPGKYSISVGLTAFQVMCNGAPLDVRLLFNPCDNFSTLALGDPANISGSGTCGTQQMSWALTRQ